MTTVPRRWHVYVVDLEPRVGTKPGKQRPCVAIQPTEFAEAGLNSTVILPLTTNKGFVDNDPPVPIERRWAVFRIERRSPEFLARWISAVTIFPCEGASDPLSETR